MFGVVEGYVGDDFWNFDFVDECVVWIIIVYVVVGIGLDVVCLIDVEFVKEVSGVGGENVEIC